MRAEINFTRKGNYIGRSGHATMHGLDILTTTNQRNVVLSPINSRGPAQSTFYEIPKEDIPNIVEALTNAMGQDWPRYFHVGTEDGVSLGVIRGKDNDELNTKLQQALLNGLAAEAVKYEKVDFKFWEKEHSTDVEVSWLPNGSGLGDILKQKRIVITYTFMQP
jgi:hypothetical protein